MAVVDIFENPNIRWHQRFTIDGVSSPGYHDMDLLISSAEVPNDLTGLSVLDVGTTNGAAAFELPRDDAVERDGGAGVGAVVLVAQHPGFVVAAEHGDGRISRGELDEARVDVGERWDEGVLFSSVGGGGLPHGGEEHRGCVDGGRKRERGGKGEPGGECDEAAAHGSCPSEHLAQCQASISPRDKSQRVSRSKYGATRHTARLMRTDDEGTAPMPMISGATPAVANPVNFARIGRAMAFARPTSTRSTAAAASLTRRHGSAVLAHAREAVFDAHGIPRLKRSHLMHEAGLHGVIDVDDVRCSLDQAIRGVPKRCGRDVPEQRA